MADIAVHAHALDGGVFVTVDQDHDGNLRAHIDLHSGTGGLQTRAKSLTSQELRQLAVDALGAAEALDAHQRPPEQRLG